VQMRSGGKAKPTDIPGIRGNLGFNQDDIEHGKSAAERNQGAHGEHGEDVQAGEH